MDVPRLFLHSPVQGHMGCFQYGMITTKHAMNILMQVSMCTCFHFTWIAELYIKSMLNCIRNCQIVFQNGHTTLHSYQQCIRVPNTSYLPQNMVLLIFLFNFSHSNSCLVISYCVVKLHFCYY